MRIHSDVKGAKLLGEILTLIKLSDSPVRGVTLHIDRFSAVAPSAAIRTILEDGGEVYGQLQATDEEPECVTILGTTRKTRQSPPRTFHVPYRCIQIIDVQFK